MCQHPVLSMNEYHAHDERLANEKILEKYECPCNDCHGGKRRKRRVIYEHMVKFGHSGIIPFHESRYPYRIQLQSMRYADTPNIDEE
jgi:hypothetical protein